MLFSVTQYLGILVFFEINHNVGRCRVMTTLSGPSLELKLEYLTKQLDNVLPTIRFNAARALGELGDPRAATILSEVAKSDQSSAVRRAAEIALLELGFNIDDFTSV